MTSEGASALLLANEELKFEFGSKIVAHKMSRINAEIRLNDEETLWVGNIPIMVIHTPGHSPDSICLLMNAKKLLTGDTLFVGECGRTDLSGGNPEGSRRHCNTIPD
jgi:glyoxylase-like metal-dependent hydrolase (beta-lactamase superfamily II)